MEIVIILIVMRIVRIGDPNIGARTPQHIVNSLLSFVFCP